MISHAVSAEIPVPTSTTDGWHFTVGQPLAYSYELSATTTLTTAGDTLPYTTAMNYRYVLQASEIADTQVTLTATILSARATQQGPGSNHLVDSTQPVGERGQDDPLLGHALALENAVFTIVCDPRTGMVREVRGGDLVAARIAKRSPSADPSRPSPAQRLAEASLSPERLAAWWSQALATPRNGTEIVCLSQPWTVTITRSWSGATWTDALPANAPSPTVSFATTPSPVIATLTALSGSGSLTPGPVPGNAKGEIKGTLRFQALTQPAEQQITLVWQRRRLLPSAPASP